MADADRVEIDGTETTPLLSGAAKVAGSANRRPQHLKTISVASIASLSIPKAHKPGTVVWILCVLIFFVAGAGGFMVIPMTRIFEDILCRQYYDKPQILGEPIDESLCKIDVIQSKLAFLFAIFESITAGVGCLAAMPWGILADK